MIPFGYWNAAVDFALPAGVVRSSVERQLLDEAKRAAKDARGVTFEQHVAMTDERMINRAVELAWDVFKDRWNDYLASATN